MAQSAHLLLRLVASSVTAANSAGKIVRDVMKKGDLGIVDKGKNDLQTEADRSAQQCIVGSLSRLFPSVNIIGEEGAPTCPCPEEWLVTASDPEVLALACPDQYHDLAESDVTVWVDPLDGTSEYTQGLLDHVTVLIGIAVKERAVAGVIHQPFYNYKNTGQGQMGRTVWGIDGVGVGGFDPKSPPEGKRIITTTRSHTTPQVQAALDALKPDEILRVGGAGHKVMLLMEGKAHAYVFASPGCKRWDTCAPEAVLTAVGGKLTDLHGRLYPYDKDTPPVNSRGVLATANADDHEWYIKNIPQEIRQTLH
ncbi:3'(2'),5'-bisphosphate nucleotidase 1 [Macrosteles quadrilineatus]|uniref:3'(2'),5'-bisphosphate nucleotidase 1 n=1 Tax=Macrosteles quadrilineatus TaxID=74068 RepID=UPI0023E2B8C8|nr:3'(2'),5'-bisphosphate nucleotidase 1 [Macrosteles quadrilineatus]XP_054258201.1 3'(2'),5'-bisphosphate nucleotidase 1 [Macrosteles quadrilineatus]XP_054258202.1 3'(2'),5'-bisphosphate nucleotidase 1 [Macrosteles quadrilineatus]XP_054258203.1 3'(2'),5'-bisphosphate nucleotidase 1 [Macrosteles quadrilineatus]XP_054258204.1 3'(2'),5'-bisphosphate nucleotidase 1 [Macrosteles quadrilineatus]XP_054258205.1 3'(2'),5'-bisphosphate nucleotidase 1 [Macrosteles quadrilineatus]XP_054258206.1 3'(2'),5